MVNKADGSITFEVIVSPGTTTNNKENTETKVPGTFDENSY